MDPMTDWIAPLIERLVSSYLNKDADVTSHTDDNGSNLRFTSCPCRGALITQWKDGSEKRPTLTDSRTQIDAILTQTSLSEYRNEAPDRLPCNSGTTGCCIQLLEFEVVFEYSGIKPETHLYVKRFKIEKSRGRSKSVQGRKTIKKNNHVYYLMWKLFREMNESSLAHYSAKVAGNGPFEDSEDSVNSQDENVGAGVSQEALMSQVPSYRHPASSRAVRNRDVSTRGSDLLTYLQAHEKVHTSGSPSGYMNQPDSHSRIPPLETERLPINSQHTRNHANEQEETSIPVPEESSVENATAHNHNSNAVEPPVSHADDNNTAGVSNEERFTTGFTRQSNLRRVASDKSHPDRHSAGQERPEAGLERIDHEDRTTRTNSLSRLSTDSNEHEESLFQGPNVQTARSKSGQTNLTQTEEKKLPGRLNYSCSDPWEGMTEIRKRDVKIPSSQRKLLENSRRWMPPDPGTNAPEAHVPPSLLTLWNSIAFWRSRVNMDKEENSRSDSSKGCETSHHSADFVDSASESNIEGVGDEKSSEGSISWSRSGSEHHDSPAQVPPDSSPIRGTIVQKTGSLDKRREDDEDDQLPGIQNSDNIKENNGAVTEPEGTRDHRNRLEVISVGSNDGREHEEQNNISESVVSSQVPREPNNDSNMDIGVRRNYQKPREQNTPLGGRTRATPELARNESCNPIMDTADISEPSTGARAAESGAGNDPDIRHEESREAESNQKPAEKPTPSKPAPAANNEVAENESDAESVMDTSVPRPLGNSSQMVLEASQAEPEVTSSGQSLPSFNTEEQVQVLVTPATKLNRLRSGKLQRGDNNWLACASQQESSQIEKSSSQSRIFNTYNSNDDREQNGPSQKLAETAETAETADSSMGHKEREVRGVDVIGTQTSNGDSQPGVSMFYSQPASALDSSAPMNHEQNTQTSTPAVQRSEEFQALSYSHCPPPSHLNDESHFRCSTERPRVVHSLKRSRRSSEVDSKEPPAKRSRLRNNNESDNEFAEGYKTPISNMVTRQQSHMGISAKHTEARKVYEKFQNDYSDYSGDFNHFIEQCARLQALRDKGELRRSFLWDDFIIMHLREYPRYEEQCLSKDTKRLEYEDFFKSSFSRPLHKKRSLTAIGIEISAAAQNGATNRSSVAASPSISQGVFAHDEASRSFTASLVDRLTDFHTFSSTTRSSNSGVGTDTNRRSVPIMSSPSPRRKTNHDTPMRIREVTAVTVESSEPETTPQPEMDTTPRPPQPDPVPNSPGESEAVTAKDSPNKLNSQDTDSRNDDEDEEMNETHETASIELGDVPTHPSNAEPEEYISETESKASSEPEHLRHEKTRENKYDWFASMAYLQPQPTGPSPNPLWSDSPTTPFKKWAEADQNTIIESRRRGRFAIPLDEKGVIIPSPPSTPYYLTKGHER